MCFRVDAHVCMLYGSMSNEHHQSIILLKAHCFPFAALPYFVRAYTLKPIAKKTVCNGYTVKKKPFKSRHIRWTDFYIIAEVWRRGNGIKHDCWFNKMAFGWSWLLMHNEWKNHNNIKALWEKYSQMLRRVLLLVNYSMKSNLSCDR